MTTRKPPTTAPSPFRPLRLDDRPVYREPPAPRVAHGFAPYWLSVAQLAHYLSTSERTAKALIYGDDPAIPSYHHGRMRRVLRSDAEAYVEQLVADERYARLVAEVDAA